MIFAIPAICFVGSTLIRTNVGGVEQLTAAQDLKAGVHKVYSFKLKDFVEVFINIQSGVSHDFIRLNDQLVPGYTSYGDLLITRGHPFLYNGEETLPQDIPGGEIVRFDTAEDLYSICTMDREFVEVAGLPVMTWSYFAFTNFLDVHFGFDFDQRNCAITLPENSTENGSIIFAPGSCGPNYPEREIVLAWDQPVTFKDTRFDCEISANNLINGNRIILVK